MRSRTDEVIRPASQVLSESRAARVESDLANQRLLDSILPHHSAFHHEDDSSQLGNILQRVTGYRDNVRELAGTDGADPIGPSHDFRRTLEWPIGLRAWETRRTWHESEFLRVLPVRKSTGVRRETDRKVRLQGLGELPPRNSG